MNEERDCEYCGKPINPLNFLTLDGAAEDLEFCGNECLEDYQEREHDRATERAHERASQ